MKTTGSRIRHLREQVLHLSQQDFGSALKVSRGAVANWERDQGIKQANLAAMAREWQIDINWLANGVGQAPAATEIKTPAKDADTPLPAVFGRRTLPVYGQAVAGFDGRFLMNGQRVQEVISPPALDYVPDAYAVFVHGVSMEPRYFAGEIVWVHPHRPVRKGDFVVAQIRSRDGDAPLGYIKRYVSMNDQRLVLEQLNPPEGAESLMTFPAESVVSVHKIIGVIEG